MSGDQLVDPRPVPASHVGLAEIATVFAWIGLSTFGGLFAVLPRLERTLHNRGWLTPSQLHEVVAVSTLVPGPTFVALAGMIGYLFQGWLGAAVAAIMVLLPSAVIIGAIKWWIPMEMLMGPLSPVTRAVSLMVAAVLIGNGLQMTAKAPRSFRGGLLLAGSMAALLLGVHVSLVVVGGVLLGALLIPESRR